MPKLVDHASRRLRFIEAARTVLFERGVERTTVREVAKRSGFTTGALLHYFNDKEELVREALNHFGDEVREEMESIKARHRGRDALRRLLYAALPLELGARSRWQAWLAMWRHSEMTASMRREAEARYAEWAGRLTEALRQSVADGELPTTINLQDEAESLIALVDGMGMQHLATGGAAERMRRQVDRYLARLYNAPGPA